MKLPKPSEIVLVKLEDMRDGIFYYLGHYSNNQWFVYPDNQGVLDRKLRYEETIINWQKLEN